MYIISINQSIKVVLVTTTAHVCVCVCVCSVLGPILFVLYITPLSDIIANHSANHQLFADDTLLQKSAPFSEVSNLTEELNACTDDIKTWMTENQFKLNDDKTEALKISLSLFVFLETSYRLPP